MPKNQESLNRKLYNTLLRYEPDTLDSDGKITPVPEDAEVFQFKFPSQEDASPGNEGGTVAVSIEGANKLVIYFDDSVTEVPGWSQLLISLKNWAQGRQLGFQPKNRNHLNPDMAKRKYMTNKEKVAEGYYATGKKSSYSDAVPAVKIILQHNRQLEEGEARYRSIAKIFVENADGERFLLPTNKPGIARVYARHIAEGGTPYDDAGKHINSLVEEYTKMAGFVRATRNNQFNESTQSLVNEGIQHYQSLRETLHKMSGRKGYQSYFESWSPTLTEDTEDTTDLSEMFASNSLDPRIESVMPILRKLNKSISEMTETTELSNWADELVAESMGDDLEGVAEGVAEGAKWRSDPDAYDVDDEGNKTPRNPNTPKFGYDPLQRRADTANDAKTPRGKTAALKTSLKMAKGNKGVAEGDSQEPKGRMKSDGTRSHSTYGSRDNYELGGPESIATPVKSKDFKKDATGILNKAFKDSQRVDPRTGKKMVIKGVAEGSLNEGQYEMMMRNGQVKKFIAKDDADAKRIAAGHGAKSVIKLRGGAPAGKVSEQGVAEGTDIGAIQALTDEALTKYLKAFKTRYGAGDDSKAVKDAIIALRNEAKRRDSAGSVEGVAEAEKNPHTSALGKALYRDLSKEKKASPAQVEKNKVNWAKNPHNPANKEQGVAEDLDANQKRVGQLGPVEKVKNNNIGKLVGTDESIEEATDLLSIPECDKEEDPLDRIRAIMKHRR